MQFFLDKGVTVTGVWHWKQSLVLLDQTFWRKNWQLFENGQNYCDFIFHLEPS